MAEGPLHLLLFQIKFQQFTVKYPKTSRRFHQASKIKAIKAIFQDDAGAPAAPSPKFKSSPPHPQKKKESCSLDFLIIQISSGESRLAAITLAAVWGSRTGCLSLTCWQMAARVIKQHLTFLTDKEALWNRRLRFIMKILTLCSHLHFWSASEWFSTIIPTVEAQFSILCCQTSAVGDWFTCIQALEHAAVRVNSQMWRQKKFQRCKRELKFPSFPPLYPEEAASLQPRQRLPAPV